MTTKTIEQIRREIKELILCEAEYIEIGRAHV